MRNFLFGLICGAILLPAAIVGCALLGGMPVNADVPPSRIESALARRAFDRSIQRVQAPANPLEVNDEVMLEGMRLYRNNCSGCHGNPGQPSDWGAHHFYPPVPQFADHPPN